MNNLIYSAKTLLKHIQMTTLILDTSQNQTVIALSNQDLLLDSWLLPHHTSLSTSLPLSIQTFLKKHDLSPKDLSAVALGIGPGSYTGTRVAATAAKTLCFSLEIPLIPYCSLLSYIPKDHNGLLYLALEAKGKLPFLIQVKAKNAHLELSAIEQENEAHRLNPDIPLFTIDKQKFISTHPEYANLNIQTSPLNLNLLSYYINNELLQGRTTPPKDLGKLQLLYLQQMPVQEAQITKEALP